MNSKKFEIIIKCKNCGCHDVWVGGYSYSRYDDCDNIIRLNIICSECRCEDTITI